MYSLSLVLLLFSMSLLRGPTCSKQAIVILFSEHWNGCTALQKHVSLLKCGTRNLAQPPQK